MNARQTLEAFLGKVSDQADLKTLRNELLAQFGGVGGLAAECKLEYDACDSGSMGKNRLLTAVLGIVGEVDKQGHKQDIIQDMTTEELQEAAASLLEHGLRTTEPGVSGGPGPEPDAAEETA